MGDLSQRLSRKEFECKCKKCGFDTVNHGLVDILEAVADDIQTLYQLDRVKIHVNSGCRCRDYNEKVQRRDPKYKHWSSRSQHMFANAVDLVFEAIENGKSWNIHPKEVYDILDRMFPDSCGIGVYNTFTHFDMRKVKARW